MKGTKLALMGSICLVVILIALTLGAGCAKPAPAPAQPIKIGALLPLTGPYAMWGAWFKRSLNFTFDEINWEVAGRPIELIIEDEGDPDVSVMMEKLRKLVEKDKIDLLSGPFFGAMVTPAWAYSSKVPIIAVNDLCCERPTMEYDYTFHMLQAYADDNYPLGRYAYEEAGCRTVSTVGWDYTCPRDFIEGFVTGFTELGGTVVQQQWTEIAAMDYTPYLLALKEADAVMSGILGSEGQMRAISQAWELGIPQKVTWFVGGMGELESEEVLAELRDRAVGAYYLTGYTPRIDTPISNKFKEKFKAKFGELPTHQDAAKYEAMQVMLAGLKATGGDTDPDKLKKAILGLKLELPSGPVSFDEGRMAIRNWYIMRVEKVNGAYESVIVKTLTDQHTRQKIYPYP